MSFFWCTLLTKDLRKEIKSIFDRDDLCGLIFSGFKIQRDGEKIRAGTCDLPANIPERLLISLKKLGGNSGM